MVLRRIILVYGKQRQTHAATVPVTGVYGFIAKRFVKIRVEYICHLSFCFVLYLKYFLTY